MTARPANLPYLAPRLRSVPTMPEPIPPAVWAQMPWPSQKAYEARVAAARRATAPPVAEGPPRVASEVLQDDRFTDAELRSGYRAHQKWRNGKGPEPTPDQKEATRTYKRLSERARRARAAGATNEGDEVGRERPEQVAARERMEAAGVEWVTVRDWAVASGRWVGREVATLNVDAVDAVDAYLAERPAEPEALAVEVPTELVEPPPSRFDPIFADPEFWSDLAGQCAVYRPHAPASFGEALTVLERGALLFLAAVDGAS